MVAEKATPRVWIGSLGELMPKTIIICCDGTGQEFSDNMTNVLRLANVLRQTGEQHVFYDPGVGTLPAPERVSAISKWWRMAMQLVFGYGLKNNIADAYRFLMLHYEPGDRIALFGYSRGAYTVRGLAGLLQVCGLLRRGNEHLIPYALKIYMNFRLWNGVDSFRVNCHEDVQVDYMGVWDTVSSMYWENRRMPHTYRNPILRVVRHAISVDEKRAFFRTNRFGSPHPGQDIREAWFPGVHGNVGGGHARGEREPELATFDWVVQGADFLDIDPAAAKRLTEPFRRGSVGPQLHESLKGLWWLAEWIPRSSLHFDKDANRWRRRWKLYRGTSRWIPEGASIHQSVFDRQETGGYAPKNLPTKYDVEPWEPEANGAASVLTG